MGGQIRDHIRGNVVGYLALFLFAMSGSAAALDGSDTVFTDDIVDGQVKTADIGTGQVRSVDVADDTGPAALTGTDVAADSLTGADVADNDSLGGAEIDEAGLDSSVLQRRLQSGCPGGQAVADVDAGGTPTCVTLGGPPSGAAGGALAGTYPNPSIAEGAVAAFEVQNNSISATEVADTSTLGTAEISEGNLFNDNSIAASDIATDAVGSLEVDGTLTGANIVDAALGTADIANDSLTGTDISESTLAKVPDADKLDGVDLPRLQNQGSYGSNSSSVCSPPASFTNCIVTGLTLPGPGNSSVLVTASGAWTGGGIGADTGQCKLRRDNATTSVGFGATVTLGQGGNEHEFYGDGFSRTAIDTNVPPGAHNYALTCAGTNGDFAVHGMQITAVRLSG